jgi:hypothetical protein
MDVQAIIMQARSENVPANWNVWPLRRDAVTRDVWNWALTGGFGLLLFVLAVHVMVPDNFRNGTGSIIVSLIILAVLGTMAFGALYLLVTDMQRLRLWGDYLLIMTPDDYVKVEPRRITHVPMDQIDSITLKGVRTPQQAAADPQPQTLMGRMLLRIPIRKPRETPLVAFRDLRTNDEVIVSRDNSFDELPALAYILELHVSAKERSRRS